MPKELLTREACGRHDVGDVPRRQFAIVPRYDDRSIEPAPRKYHVAARLPLNLEAARYESMDDAFWTEGGQTRG